MISLFFYIGNCSTTSVSDSEGSDSDSDIGQQAKVIMVSSFHSHKCFCNI